MSDGDREFGTACVGVPWQLRPEQRRLENTAVLVSEADPGVALVIVVLEAPKHDRRRYLAKRSLAGYGYTDECPACAQLGTGMRVATVPHDDRCRDHIGDLIPRDDDPKQSERIPAAPGAESARSTSRRRNCRRRSVRRKQRSIQLFQHFYLADPHVRVHEKKK